MPAGGMFPVSGTGSLVEGLVPDEGVASITGSHDVVSPPNQLKGSNFKKSPSDGYKKLTRNLLDSSDSKV